MTDRKLELAFFEAQVLQKLQGCQNVLEFIDKFEDDKFFCIVTQLMDMDLAEYIKQHGELSEEKATKVFSQIAKGILACHEHSFIHRDLKPENILVKVDKQNQITDVCISDFGLSA